MTPAKEHSNPLVMMRIKGTFPDVMTPTEIWCSRYFFVRRIRFEPMVQRKLWYVVFYVAGGVEFLLGYIVSEIIGNR